MKLYTIYNGAMPTTAALTKQATGTAIRTMLQLATPTTKPFIIYAWGCSFDGTAAATPGQIELVETDVAASGMTAHVAANAYKVDPSQDNTAAQMGAALTGYAPGSAVTEGSTAATRLFDYQMVAPTNQYVYQFPSDARPVQAASKFLRIRMTFGTTINALCWITWGEQG